MKKLMTGNEAIARGLYEAGVHFASAYPGTPSTEVLENVANYDEIYSEWAPNEKVAYEAVYGASLAGARSFAAMKHVGLNVAADPFFTSAYVGVNGGLVVLTADEPGQFSSQNEQDNRNYAKAAKVPMFEPSNSQECKDMLKDAYKISEEYDFPVLYRTTTRVNHSKGLVDLEDRAEVELRDYKPNVEKTMAVPATSRLHKIKLQKNMEKLLDYSNDCKWNYIEDNNSKIGFVCSGVSYQYAKEAYGDEASYLKVGFSNPLPDGLFKEFDQLVDTIYVIEENDPYIEERLKVIGIDCIGKELFPENGEMLPNIIKEAIETGKKPIQSVGVPRGTEDKEVEEAVIDRAPTLCAGCPHRGILYSVGNFAKKKKNIMLSGDIGCYSLAYTKPYNAIHSNICMGDSFSMGHGASKVFEMKDKENPGRVISILGDSTFFHTGINSLIEVIYNKSNTINIILDNRTTGMTGQQENPGTGKTLQQEVSNVIELEPLVKDLGFKNVVTINPNKLDEVEKTLNWAYDLNEPVVIITRWPCALKKQSEMDKEEFKDSFTDTYAVDHDKCIGCKKCTRTGCPAISFDTENKKSNIDSVKCIGCSVCAQVCPVDAISLLKGE